MKAVIAEIPETVHKQAAKTREAFRLILIRRANQGDRFDETHRGSATLR